jgi:predicted dehydrogenase/glycerophosphoryl diester phosphodiesterase
MGNLRIGMVGTGRIAQRFAKECETVEGVELTAIYHPRISSARFFAEQNHIETDSLLLTDDKPAFLEQVDAVYIAAPHEFHEAYIREFLQEGKHVLCEKPFALSEAEAKALFALAEEKELVCMEAIKTAYCPGFLAIKALLAGGAIGMPYDVEACFTKIGSAAGRELWGEHAGSFVELGSYPLLPIVRIFGTKNRENYIWSLDSALGPDSYTKMVISYPLGTATAKTGLGVKSEGTLIIAGERGYIKVPAPWWLTTRVEVHHEDANRVEVYDFPFEGYGLRYEIAAFRDKILGVENESERGLLPEDSIWMAKQMETFLRHRRALGADRAVSTEKTVVPKIWAHRGCSMRYPENTLLAFHKAAEIPGITGIELDVQLTKDGQMVVIHDEKVDRTTTGSGYVKDYTLAELKKLQITPSGREEVYHLQEPDASIEKQIGDTLTIPTLEEVFILLQPYCKKNHFMINIELKNSVIRYEGMEQQVMDLVAAYGLEDNIVYSSFLHESMGLIKKLKPEAQTGTLADDMLNCLEGWAKYGADAVHPGNRGMAINSDTVDLLRYRNIPVRMWNMEEPLFGQSRELKDLDLRRYTSLGATDIITNVPEKYLKG